MKPEVLPTSPQVFPTLTMSYKHRNKVTLFWNHIFPRLNSSLHYGAYSLHPLTFSYSWQWSNLCGTHSKCTPRRRGFIF